MHAFRYCIIAFLRLPTSSSSDRQWLSHNNSTSEMVVSVCCDNSGRDCSKTNIELCPNLIIYFANVRLSWWSTVALLPSTLRSNKNVLKAAFTCTFGMVGWRGRLPRWSMNDAMLRQKGMSFFWDESRQSMIDRRIALAARVPIHQAPVALIIPRSIHQTKESLYRFFVSAIDDNKSECLPSHIWIIILDIVVAVVVVVVIEPIECIMNVSLMKFNNLRRNSVSLGLAQLISSVFFLFNYSTIFPIDRLPLSLSRSVNS